MSPGQSPAAGSPPPQPSPKQSRLTPGASSSHHEADTRDWLAYSTAIGHRRRIRLAATLTSCALVWVLIALAGIYTVTLVPAAILLAISTPLVRPRVAAPTTRTLDVALFACGAFVVVQGIPLPAALRDVISPHARSVEDALTLTPGHASMLPLTVDPAATWSALVSIALIVLMFFVAREVCAEGGMRRLVRTIAWTGLVAAAAAVVVRPALPGGILSLVDASDTPMYGPFVNRNHMGTWLIMALPLVIGYIAARMADRMRYTAAHRTIDTLMIWLTASAVVMLIATVASLSRSAMVGAVAAAVFFGMVGRPRRSARSRGIGLLVAAAAVAIVLTNSQSAGLMARFHDSRTTATWSRAEIWRQTLPIVRDFPILGAGAGAYGRAMLVYQESDRALFFNQAHNQALQIAAEGGIVLLVLVTVAMLALAREIAALLRSDRSPLFWIRLGAASGIVGVLIQSLWETGLRIPANGLLFAVLCAVASFKIRHRADERPTTRPSAVSVP
jgi:O-antigen ligase